MGPVESFIEMSFQVVGEQAHREAVEAIRLISGVEVLLDHTRERGWFARQRLMVPEWDCHIVVWVHERLEEIEPERRVSTERDPYRFLDFDGPKRQVPTRLADVLESLGASYGLVERGWLRFETRHYEPEVCSDLQTELEGIARRFVRGEFAYTGSLVGRLEGSIPKIRELQRVLQRSGMVDPAHLNVGYQ